MDAIILETNMPALAEILDLYQSVGWAAYTEQPEALYRALENSRHPGTVSGKEGG